MKRKRKSPYYKVLVRFPDGAFYHKSFTFSPLAALKNWMRAKGAPGDILFIPDEIQDPAER